MRRVGIQQGFAALLALPLAGGLAGHASATQFKVLHSFCHQDKFACFDGKSPAANLVADASGNLYGTTSAGGATGNGVIFEMVRSGRTYKYKVLHSFDGNGEGGVPVTSMIVDTAGNLYGTATGGGSNFGGTAFELSPNADHTEWTYKVLINFCFQAGADCIEGSVPETALAYAGSSTGAAYDGVSALYGTTLEGPNSPGIVYQLTPNGGSWSGEVLYQFCAKTNCTDGGFPEGQIAVDSSGKSLYGTTNGGGDVNGDGVAYKLDIASRTETTLHAFCSEANCTDGQGSQGGVTLASDHTVVGTTPIGGANNGGTVFKLNAKTAKEKILYSLCSQPNCTDGEDPTAAVTPDGASFLGTAIGGTPNLDGVVFRVNGNTETVLHTFCQEADCTDGSLPIGVVVNSDGNIYGVTQRGGKRRAGVLYQLKD
jgi:uncharacterized repeat protein (TIGR03803 family)